MRLLLALLFLWLLVVPEEAAARVSSAPPPPTTTFCPNGDLLPGDTCGQSPIVTRGREGEIKFANCWGSGGDFQQLTGDFSGYNANPSTLTTTGARGNTVPYNDPACAMAVGNPTPLSALAEPALCTLGPNPVGNTCTSQIPGCTIANSGPGGNPVMTCSGGSLPHDVADYNFSSTANHPCIPVKFVGSGLTGIYTWERLTWINNGNCAVANGFPYFLLTSNATNITTVVQDVTADGNAKIWDTFYGSCAHDQSNGQACSVTQPFNFGSNVASGNIIVRRVAFSNFLLRGIAFGLGSGSSFTFDANYAAGNNWRDKGDHAEWMFPNGFTNPGPFEMSFNNILYTTGNAQSNEAWAPSNFLNGLGGITMDHNFVLGSHPGGANGGTATATIAAGTSTLTVTALGAGQTLGSGASFTSCTGVGVAGSLTGMTWTPLDGQPALRGGGYGPQSGVPQHWGFDYDTSSPTYAVTGFVDDGLGGGSYDGASGNVLTVTTPGLINIVPNAAVTIPLSFTSAVASLDTGTGGAGRYILTSNGNLSSRTFSIGVPNLFDGGWSAQTTLTCPSQGIAGSVGGLMFLDLQVINASYGTPTNPTPVILTNNAIGDAPWGSTYNRAWWRERGPLQKSVNTFPIFGFIDDGSANPLPSGIPGNVLTVLSGGLFNIFPNAAPGAVGAVVAGAAVQASTLIRSQLNGTTGHEGQYAIGVVGTFTGQLNPAGTLDVTSDPTNTLFLDVGAIITGTGITGAAVTITGQNSGTPGGQGNYGVSRALTIGPETMTGNGPSNQVVNQETMNMSQAGCSGPTRFGGNLSLSGFWGPTVTDGWSATIAGSGCH